MRKKGGPFPLEMNLVYVISTLVIPAETSPYKTFPIVPIHNPTINQSINQTINELIIQ